MLLRQWQAACINQAQKQFAAGDNHFFCQATPAAGKTRMSAELAKRMLATGMIELVICFAPSREVVEGFRLTFERVIGKSFNGRLGSVGTALTYQAMDYLGDDFWSLFRDHKVLAIFDEIHHCAADASGKFNAWGQVIVQRIQNEAAFTLALSGTPWRTDDTGIALAKYSSPEGQLICDFRYGLAEAVEDKVCRSPRIVMIDNENVQVTRSSSSNSHEPQIFNSIPELLESDDIRYQDLLANDQALLHLLELANRKLFQLRQTIPDAAGLVVASTIDHAIQIASVLRSIGEMALVVTSESTDARQCIHRFRSSNERWIIAVGMIAEGTDVPRIQVCCHLSRIRTELHYRQVLGRALRRRGEQDAEAWLYMFAEPLLSGFAERIAMDLPDDLAVLSTIIVSDLKNKVDNKLADDYGHKPHITSDLNWQNSIEIDHSLTELSEKILDIRTLGFSERFRHQLLAIF